MSQSHLARSYALTDNTGARTLYEDWAASYDSDLAKSDQEYVAPATAAAHVLQHLGVPSIPSSMELLDAGCGTGLVGVELHRAGAHNIDGVDLSIGMLDLARKTGAYRSLDTADLSKPLDCDENKYDIVVCIGTMTQGHVGPVALDGFVRVTKPGGLIVGTVLGYIYESGGYKDKIESLVGEDKIQLLGAEMADYRRGAGIQARMIVLKVRS
jgi:predicted TPR repeat methyltransferase